MSKDVEGNKKQPNTLLKSLFVLGVFGAIALLIAFVKPASSEEKKSNNSISRDQVSKICELATLKCYYHDVAEETVEPAAPFRYGLFRFGYKKFWIEYDGIVELGIDADKVDIVEPEANDTTNTIKVYMPKARVLNAYMDEDSMQDAVLETGAFTTVTTEDHVQAYARTQANMKEKAGSDESLITEATENAKKLLENLINEVWNQPEAQYKIEWSIDSSNESQAKDGETPEGKTI